MRKLPERSTRSIRIFAHSTAARTIYSIGLAGALGLLMSGQALAQTAGVTSPAAGTWLTEDGDARIAIAECEDGKKELCGTIVGLKQPHDPKTGKPPTDKNNPDVAKRSQPIVGVQIVRGMKPSGKPGQWKGEVYNPNDGRIYSANLIMKRTDEIRLEGCMLFICSGETWTRADPVAADAPLKPSVTGSTKPPAGPGLRPTINTGSTAR